MHALARRLFPICRSITGDGVRQTLSILREHLPTLEITEVPSGTKVFDWTIPDEWNLREAWISGPDGRKIVDTATNNLHVVSYSVPVRRRLSLDELQRHLHSKPELPDAIPYVTSYYSRNWGFCLSQRQRDALLPGDYEVCIDASLTSGSLTYGEFRLPGTRDKEILLSTYVCHPSMANNELSGPIVATFIAKWLMSLQRRGFGYRLVFVPETIGTLAFLSRSLDELKRQVAAGFVLTCIGDERAYSYLASRRGNTLADRAARHSLKHLVGSFNTYDYLDRASDERQYGFPTVDLPVCSLMRSKYGTYPEYHTSLDNLDLVTPLGLEGGFRIVKHAIECLEANQTYRATTVGEPQLGRYGLYPSLGGAQASEQVRVMLNLLAYSDGEIDLLAIADLIARPLPSLLPAVRKLVSAGLLAPSDGHTER